jgi:hypothetical protein
MRTLLTIWLLLLFAALAPPTHAQNDDLFGDEPAKEEPADDAPAGDAAADETAPSDAEAKEAAPAADGGDDLFGGEADDESAPSKPPQDAAEPDAPPKPTRKLHTQAEIKAELQRQNGAIATELAKFIELNKQVAKQAVEGGNNDELMQILREYGPAVIRTKQLWIAVVGNPAKYDTWLGSADYWKAWVAFHNSWRTLYGYTDRFAAVDLDLADKLTDALATLGTSFQDYSEWVDEWDRELGNDKYAFARGDDKLGKLDREQMREEEGADDETAEAFADQEMEEEDATAPSDVEEAREATESADEAELAEGEKEADAAADKKVEEIDKEEDAAVEGEDDLFGEESATEEEMPPKEEPAAEGDDLFGDE